MKVSKEKIIHNLENIVSKLKNDDIDMSKSSEHYTLVFASRPQSRADGLVGQRMIGSQTFDKLEDAASFMHKKISVFGQFVSAKVSFKLPVVTSDIVVDEKNVNSESSLNVMFDGTQILIKAIRKLGKIKVFQWVVDTHPDFDVPEFMKDIGYDVVNDVEKK